MHSCSKNKICNVFCYQLNIQYFLKQSLKQLFRETRCPVFSLNLSISVYFVLFVLVLAKKTDRFKHLYRLLFSACLGNNGNISYSITGFPCLMFAVARVQMK